MFRIKGNKLGVVYTSREALHELYYVSIVDDLIFLDTTTEIDLLALTIMKQYGATSIFDAYYAATALNQVPDRTMVSTDQALDRIPGLNRIDPHALVRT